MYLRTTQRKNKDGSTVAYYQLAHNERHPVTRKPVAKIIHNFSRVDQLDREQLVRLCRSIARVCGLTVIDPAEPQQQLLPLSGTVGLPEDLKFNRTVSFGPVLAVEAIWQRVGIKKTSITLLAKTSSIHSMNAPFWPCAPIDSVPPSPN